MALLSSSSLLINATGSPVWILVDGSPVRLKEIPAPELIGMPSRDSGVSPLPVRASKYYGGEPTELTVDGPSDVLYTCERIPSVREGIIYLVTPENFSQFPYRPDFVCPSSYLMVKEKRKKKVMDKRGKKAKGKKGTRAAQVKYRSVLASVTYEPQIAVWSEDELPPSLHDEIWVSLTGKTVSHGWETVKFPGVPRHEQTEEEYQARLASDVDFFFGPGAEINKAESGTSVQTAVKEEVVAVEAEPAVPAAPPVYAPPSAWVKGVGVVEWETALEATALPVMNAEETARMEENAAAVRYLLGLPAPIPDDEDDENHPT